MSTLIKPTRRGLIIGLGSLIAAPAVVRAQNIMPVKVIPSLLENGDRLLRFALCRSSNGDLAWVPIDEPCPI